MDDDDDIGFIPPVEIDMVVEDAPIVFEDDDKFSKYKEEMLTSGLLDTDVEYFVKAYKNLEDVKYIRIHCTSCDKHIGSAPNDFDKRYQHPLLKVLLCGDCYGFYASGEFEKGEDGSELYCRWCGDGGQVYCCTECPFVFCKKCIRRNLGRGTAKKIENTENWICFHCNPEQISRHRATYWAIQKYSEEGIKTAHELDATEYLSIDSNICCTAVKKRTEIYDKLKSPPAKRSRTMESTKKIPENIPSTSNTVNNWTAPVVVSAPEAQLVCTPDIIPIEDSPPNSPAVNNYSWVQKPVHPPPLTPLQTNTLIQPLIKLQHQPIIPTIPMQAKINIDEIHHQLQSVFQQKIIVTPASQLLQSNTVFTNQTPLTIEPQKSYLVVTTPNNSNNVLKPITTTSANLIKPSSSASNSNSPIPSNSLNNDWFDKATSECAKITEYMNTKISGLTGVHSRAYKSDKLMEELHNTLQTYVHVTITKLRKMKRNMQANYERECKKNPNPFSKTQPTRSDEEETSNSSNVSEAGSNNSRPPEKRNKTTISRNLQPDEYLFDMDVTNASDEETDLTSNYSSNSATTPFQVDEVINILDSSDESDHETKTKSNQNEQSTSVEIPSKTEKEEPVEVSPKNTIQQDEDEINDLLIQLKNKYNINLSLSELLNFVSARIVIKNNSEVQNEFREIAMLETESVDSYSFDIVAKLKSLLETESKEEIPPTNDQIEEEICDIEDMLSRNILIRKPDNKSFDEVFSNFVNQTNQNNVEECLSLEEKINEEEDDLGSMVFPDIFKNDNSSLSEPPDNILNHIQKTKENGDDLGVLALKQIAENCINSPVEVRQQT